MTRVIGFAGFSNSGKTTLITKLISILQQQGLRIAIIKHDGHGHYKEMDNSDSSRYVVSGAQVVVLSGSKRVIRIESPQVEPTLSNLIKGIQAVDLILVEGYKQSEYPKIAVMRTEDQVTIMDQFKGELLAIAAGFKYEYPDKAAPIFDLNDSQGIAEFVRKWLKNKA